MGTFKGKRETNRVETESLQAKHAHTGTREDASA